ncbi:MAG: N-6 DNA methylase, partial [Candidatus Caldarchaeum sp.]
SQTTGYSPDKLRELKRLVEEYGFRGKVDYNFVIFSLHTYYALVMKLLAAEIAYLYGAGRWLKSYVGELENAYLRGGVDSLKTVLRELEEGGVFANLLNIVNFIEGDYFSWYLDVLDKDLGDAVAEVARRLSDYEPATPQLEPELARDLLKRLYESLIPRDVRHKLGEFYTPDWLAELVLNEVGLTVERFEELGAENRLRPLELRVLDPACGSGTFLVLYLRRLREYAEEHYMVDQLVEHVLRNVVGFDLNPLAVIAARTNYLLAIGDLLTYARGRVEIPVYLADSILVETKSDLRGQVFVLRTVVGSFEIPKTVVDSGLLSNVLSDIRMAVDNRYTVNEFRGFVGSRYQLSEGEVDVLAKLFDVFLKLEREGKNHVWVSIVRNAFAPILKGRFDYVVGNPPWVNWENLPEDYRAIAKPLWENVYGLVGGGAGSFKRDLATFFLVRCFDNYLKPGGRLGFLMPFTVFKAMAGAGFRKFLATKTRVVILHDMVTLYPFEDAVNRTSAIIVEKVCELSDINSGKCLEINKVAAENKNVRHVIWSNKLGKPIGASMALEEVLKVTDMYVGIMAPIFESNASSPWIQTTVNLLPVIRKIISGTSTYRAYAGVLTALNQVYCVQVEGRLPDGRLMIKNPSEPGQKKRVKQAEAAIEPELVYPLIRGRDVKKWYVDHKDRYIILPHDNSSGAPLSHSTFKVKYPNTYKYLYHYKEELVNRSIKPFIQAHKKKKLSELYDKFYILDNIGKYTFAPYKVVWKNIAGAITGKATDFQAAVVEPRNDKWLGPKIVIPNVKLMLTPVADKDEAYYLCAILNSTPIKYVAASYMIETGISTNLYEYIILPKYDARNKLHRDIAELGKKAHELAAQIYASNKPDLIDQLRYVENEIDKAVAELYGLSDEELAEIKRFFAILAGEEMPEEEAVDEDEKAELTVTFPKTVLTPNQPETITIHIINPDSQPLTITLQLPDNQTKTLTTNSQEHSQDIPINPLPPGTYTLTYTIQTNNQTIKQENIEITVTQPRRFRT